MSEVLLALKDGDILNFSESHYRKSEGCETCNYGSSYVQDFTVTTTQSTTRYDFDAMYEYRVSHDYLFKLFLPNAAKIQEMTVKEFEDWLTAKFKELDPHVKITKLK